jgi:DNA helicase-2/ATP-dependent DNA helicase PcrA
MSKNSWEERYNKLNDQQKKAVDTVDGAVLVVAGPGSGKTELLSIRTANILKQTDISPCNILLLTFTDSGSFNMRERLISLIGEDAYRITVCTFHSFAGEIMSRHPEYFFEGAKFSSASDIDQITIITNILKTLPRNNPLSSYHPEQGYVYTRDILSAISDLKKGNFTPEKFADKIKENQKELKNLKKVLDGLEAINGKRKYEDVVGAYVNVYEKLKKFDTTLTSITHTLCTTLELAINNASVEQKTKHLTNWKNTYTSKTEEGNFILKDAQPERAEKLESLLGVYSLYQAELYKNALYDYDDMILFVIKAISENGNLKADLQEKYQYIMIDEFQDTNESQFQLVLELTKNSYLNDNPNVLAVGDDDQAIFKFQGAEINNIYNFINNFKQTKVIVLDKNYRSTQNILDFARNVILKAEDRLETRDKNINKKISAENLKFLEKSIGEIKLESFESEILEQEYVAKEIKKLIESGVDKKEIAVICRKHDQLQNLAKVLGAFDVDYSYSKKENILEKQHIRELITIVKYLALQQEGRGDELLPEILSFNFWCLDRVEIWKIAQNARENNTTWLAEMISTPDIKIKQIANFLIELSVKTPSTPLEYLLDEIIGTTDPNPAKDFTSPYKKYYFNGDRFKHNKKEYLDFLFALRTFIGALREFNSLETLHAKDILDFIEVYNGNNLVLSAVSPFNISQNSVQLLTAHAAKGLEFEYVFLLSANNEVWTRGVRASKIPFPSNMPLSPDSDNDDDKIRLLYVAITRAKHSLYITHSSHRLEYLSEHTDAKETESEKSVENVKVSKELVKSLELNEKKALAIGEKELLKRLLENYKMPVTHLNNFINFTRVGPAKFIEHNLLHFPQAQTASSAYGSAMHSCIEQFFTFFSSTNKYQEIEEV